jgi:hypothetical protein
MTDLLHEIENVDRLPEPDWPGIEGELLDDFVNQYETDRQIWGEWAQSNLERLERGELSLAWMSEEGSHWGTAVKPSKRGLTLDDINRSKAYGAVPDRTEYRNVSPRGSVREPYRHLLPEYPDFDVVDKWDVWADNCAVLYEEAKVRQWNATRDIPWSDLSPVSEDLEKAACQLATFLTEIEFLAGDFPAKWMSRMPADFLEVKTFLASQIMDEARHLEVFRKRALAGGGGLMHVTPCFEWAGKSLMVSPTHSMGGFFLNLLGEGFILSVFRAGEFIAKTQVDREIFRLCMQDEARHVAFGTIEMKNYLENHPDPELGAERMHRFADVGELLITSSVLEPTVIEPLALLLAGSKEDLDEGMDGFSMLWQVIRDEYLQRCDRAGFDRRDRCKIPEDFPWNTAA